MRETGKFLPKSFIVFSLKYLLLAFCLFLCACGQRPNAHEFRPTYAPFLGDDDALNLYCLRLAYPQIESLQADKSGKIWLIFTDGRKIPYLDPDFLPSPLAADIKTSMLEAYPLEPDRPSTLQGEAPGRKRPYALFEALYGSGRQQIISNLKPVHFNGGTLNLTGQAAGAFQEAAPKLTELGHTNTYLKSLLKPDGGFMWRNIAGASERSGHAYGIALDLSANKAPYWRWAKTRPHPLQKTYPGEIVAALEQVGFIWGGKWAEYDLMHFEYRPELICKAAIRRAQGLRY